MLARCNSNTSISFTIPSSILNLKAVLTMCQPWIPAAPGLIHNMLRFWSLITFRICEWPHMKTSGWYCSIRAKALLS